MLRKLVNLRNYLPLNCLKIGISALQKHLVNQIHMFGPITIAEYMLKALTHPTMGYYTRKNVLGKKGDFITSPEISQIFGELIGVWVYHEWREQNSPENIQIVELGPGRGTLFCDVLRTFSSFSDTKASISLQLIEINPVLRNLQEQALKNIENTKVKNILKSVGWYHDISCVPQAVPTFFLANEFFDALPIHQFKKSDNSWREILIGTKPSPFSDFTDDNRDELCFIRSREVTPAQVAYLSLFNNLDERSSIEVAPKSAVLIHKLATTISLNGGAALIIDYGHSGDKINTLRGFSNHRVCNPLSNPGEIDLTADVDFDFLIRMAHQAPHQVKTFGPVTQASFLINMGLLKRFKILMASCKTDTMRHELLSGVEMLISRDQMGGRFNFLALLPYSAKDRLPAGFATD